MKAILFGATGDLASPMGYDADTQALDGATRPEFEDLFATLDECDQLTLAR